MTRPTTPKRPYRGGSTLTESRRAELGWGPRISLRLPSEAYEILERLSTAQGRARTEIISLALAAFAMQFGLPKKK